MGKGIILSIILFASVAGARAQTLGLPIYDCGTLLDTKSPQTPVRLEDKPTLRVMTYNIENLLDFNLPKKPDDRPKSPEKIREIFQIINDTDPDVAILQEVETIDVGRMNYQTVNIVTPNT